MDFRTIIDQQMFAVRATALIVRDGKILLTKDLQGLYYTIGGAIEVNELTSDAVCREVFEELGIAVRVDHLAFVVENHFCQADVNFHNIEFHYLVSPLEEPPLEMIENQTKQVCEWVALEDLQTVNLVPDFLKKSLPNWSGQVQHIVNQDDKDIRKVDF